MDAQMLAKEFSHILAIQLTMPVDENSNIKMEDSKNWDSLKHIEIIMSIEEYFKISFSPEEIPYLNSQQKLLKRIKELYNA